MHLPVLLAVSSFALLLAACGGSESDTADSSAARIAELEASGALPVLDRGPGVRGPDTDGNGIRDDIDAHIAGRQLEPGQAHALAQFARAMQSALLADPADNDAVRQASTAISRAGQCLEFRQVAQRSAVITAIESRTANTRERSAQYMAFNQALSGSVARLLSGDTCDD